MSATVKKISSEPVQYRSLGAAVRAFLRDECSEAERRNPTLRAVAVALERHEARRLLTPRALRQRLQAQLSDAVQQKDLAERYGVSSQYISKVLRGDENAGLKLAGKLGYERVVRYRRLQNG